MIHGCFTYGYAGRPVADLIAYLREFDAVCLDIRYSPYSRDPRWTSGALVGAINEAAQSGELTWKRGLYQHIPAYGNRNYKNGGPIALANPIAGRALVAAALQHHSVILLCVCREVERCHRQTVGFDLLEAGLCARVEHLPAEYAAWQPVQVVG